MLRDGRTGQFSECLYNQPPISLRHLYSAMSDTPDNLSDLYKIGTVAKLTGIAVERLRAWERRYGLTPASREGKTRFFSAEQVERLTRIKRLIDQGHPVSTLINLSNEALNDRLQTLAPPPTKATASATPTVALVGTQLLMLEQGNSEAARVTVSGRWVNLDVCLPELEQLTADTGLPDVLVMLQGSVTPDSLDRLNSLPSSMARLVIYHYATDEGLAVAAERNLTLLRWPVSWAEIEQAVARLARAPLKAGRHAPKRFSDEQLLSIASASDGLGCACPADLVHLISALNAFTDHSAACASGTELAADAANDMAKGPLNAARQPRHARIAERTSSARLELELVLEDWVTAEGLLPAPN